MVAKMHRMHLPKVGEGVLYLPGGVPYEADDAPLPYPAGSFMRLGNKEFIYAIAGNTLKTDRGAKNPLTQKVGFSALPVKIVAGDLTVSITVGAGVGGVSKDELKGGEIVVFGPDNAAFTRGIVGNTLVAAEGGTMVVTMDSPAPKDIALGEHAECMASPYSGVAEENNGWSPVMGIPTVEATVGQGVWLQVSGPCWLSPVLGAAGPGGAAGLLELEFQSDGSLAVAAGSGLQRAGSVVSDGGTTQGAPFVMLQIAH